MNAIDIATVLSKLDDTFDENTHEVKSYGLRFITRKGEKHEVICRKNVKSPKQTQQGADERGKVMFNLQRTGVVMVQDMNNGHPITPKVAMIYGFRDHRSNNWVNVFHG